MAVRHEAVRDTQESSLDQEREILARLCCAGVVVVLLAVWLLGRVLDLLS
jgi:hypothetical protein